MEEFPLAVTPGLANIPGGATIVAPFPAIGVPLAQGLHST